MTADDLRCRIDDFINLADQDGAFACLMFASVRE